MISTIKEFLKHLDSNLGTKFHGTDWDATFVSQLLNDFGILPGVVNFLGCVQNKYSTWNEYMVLYELSKTAELGESLKCLGRVISRLSSNSGYEFGLQEVDVTKPDKYYVLIYGREVKS